MSELRGIARFTFLPGGGEDFKRLSPQCMEVVTVSGETLGVPSTALTAMLEGSPVRLFRPFGSLDDRS